MSKMIEINLSPDEKTLRQFGWIALGGFGFLAVIAWFEVLIFAFGYGLARLLNLRYEDAAPTAMIGASNHFEVAIATAAMLYGLSSGAALATVVGVLIEVPLMLMLVRICLRTRGWFDPKLQTA